MQPSGHEVRELVRDDAKSPEVGPCATPEWNKRAAGPVAPAADVWLGKGCVEQKGNSINSKKVC